MSCYYDHDVNVDPILVLPCGHFFATSTLDGHLAMSEVYERTATDSIEYTSTKRLASASINEKPRTCPECRQVIHSINRYRRILRLSELRSLERKHSMEIHALLKHVENKLENQHGQQHDDLIKPINELQIRIRKSPMTRVYEACETLLGPNLDVPKPPVDQSIRILELKGRAHSLASKAFGDKSDKMARKSFREAIDMADASEYRRSGASIRLRFCQHLLRWAGTLSETTKKEAVEMLDQVIHHRDVYPELAEQASTMKTSFLDPTRELREVVAAMNLVQGYNYGGNWSSHWYECPNGHPYFIGECGGAMQVSTCIECGAAVGGTSHQLNDTNRPAQGLIARVMNRN
jgi:hypothetical protein